MENHNIAGDSRHHSPNLSFSENDLHDGSRQHGNGTTAQLFADNAFLLLANRGRIMGDSRMRHAAVGVDNGLAYHGRLATATLGAYIEWWTSAPYSVMFGHDDTMALVWHVAGSPLSGRNRCSTVAESGTRETVELPFFRKIWPRLARLTAAHHDAAATQRAYSLEEVIDILKSESTEEFRKSSISEFRHLARTRLLTAQLHECREQLRQEQAAAAGYQRKWHLALIRSRADKAKQFHDSLTAKEDAISRIAAELKEQNGNLKAKLRRGELSNKEYQQALTRCRKEIEHMHTDLHTALEKDLAKLFPEIAAHGHTDYKEENITAAIREYFRP